MQQDRHALGGAAPLDNGRNLVSGKRTILGHEVSSCGKRGKDGYFGGSILSRPPMYGRRAAGMVTDPSAFW